MCILHAVSLHCSLSYTVFAVFTLQKISMRSDSDVKPSRTPCFSFRLQAHNNTSSHTPVTTKTYRRYEKNFNRTADAQPFWHDLFSLSVANGRDVARKTQSTHRILKREADTIIGDNGVSWKNCDSSGQYNMNSFLLVSSACADYDCPSIFCV